MDDRDSPVVRRRDLLGLSAAAAVVGGGDRHGPLGGGCAVCPSATRRMTRAGAARTLVADMAAFVRMYEPHEAREDTVVFPAFRGVVPAKEFLRLAEVFEDEEHRRFGPRGFEGVVDQVADIEKALGIYDLSRFTPPG
ncbi:hypothetical protein [Microbispora sp. NPDC046933]|uniref:hemerythrin domain-containing protein n=1 Tax=Microbispora sp. NPDC046933 TaxID=3155618 RepID=UPI0033F60495